MFLLQVRPITTLYPLPEAMLPEPLQVLLSLGAVQGLLEPITPVGRDALCAVAAGAASVLGYRVTLRTQRLFLEAGERLWINLTGLVNNRVGRRVALSVREMIEPAALGTLATLVQTNRLASPGPLSLLTILRLVRVFPPMISRSVRTFLFPDSESRRLLRDAESLIASLERQMARTTSLASCVALIRQEVPLAMRELLLQFVPRFGAGMAAYNLLNRLAISLPEGVYSVQAVTRGLPHNVTSELDLALWRTAETIQSDPAASAHFQRTTAEELAAEYLARALPQPAQGALDKFMHRYGMRGLGEIDLGRPRWREDPRPVMHSLHSYLAIRSANRHPGTLFAHAQASGKAELERLVQALRQTRGGWFNARLARWAAHRMRTLMGLRETPKFTIIQLLGIMRSALLKHGRRLVKSGTLQCPDDVCFLHLAEMEDLDASKAEDWATLLHRRRAIYSREQGRRQIPRLLLSDGEAFYEGVALPEDENDSAVLRGSPVSPGVVEGLAHIVFDPQQAQLAPGEILVCPGTYPSWTPLFLTAGALVMEIGGMMTHGAVVPREFGIPAVVGVHEATRRLHSGQRIRVNGSTGSVTVLGDAVSQDPEPTPR